MHRLLAMISLVFLLLLNTACSDLRSAQLRSLASTTTIGLHDITWSKPSYETLHLNVYMPNQMESIRINGTSSLPYQDVIHMLQDRLTAAGWQFTPRLTDPPASNSDCTCSDNDTDKKSAFIHATSSRTVPRGADAKFAIVSEHLELLVAQDSPGAPTTIELTLQGFYVFDYPARAINGTCYALSMFGGGEAGATLILYVLSPVLIPTYYLF